MEKYVIFAVLMTVLAALEVQGRSRRVAEVLCFVSGFSMMLFREEGLLLSIGALLTFWCVVPGFVRSSMRRSTGVAPGLALVVACAAFLALLGVLSGLYHFDHQYSQYSEQSLGELVSVSLFPVVVALFIVRVWPHFYADPVRMLQAATASVVLQLFAVLASTWGFSEALPAFLNSSVSIVDESGFRLGDVTRYGALIGDYELIVDYAIIVIGIAAVISAITEKYLYSTTVALCAVLLGLYSGTRSFVVVLGIAGSVLAGAMLLLARKGRSRTRVAVGLFVLMPAAGMLIYQLMPDLLVFQRLAVAIVGAGADAGLEATLNRSFSGSVGLLLDEVSVLGAGGFLLPDINGNEMVSHNLLLASYARYGIFGLLALSLLVAGFVRRIRAAYRSADTDGRILEISIYLAFTVALLAQQMKVSGLRSSAVMLVYAIWFVLIYQRTRPVEGRAIQYQARRGAGFKRVESV